MSETVTFTISKSVGYSGKNAAKTWIAEIVGTDKTYIFCREFVDTECTDKEEMFTARRKRKGSWTEAAACPVGLYEINAGSDDRRYRVVWLKDGKIAATTIDESRALQMALRMDDGMTCEEARVATRVPPKDAEVQAGVG